MLALYIIALVQAVTIDEFAPVPPFPHSDLAPRVRVAAVSAGGPKLHEGDTWPATWASDGTTYVAGCDNKALINGVKTKVGLDFFALHGSPEVPSSLALTLQSAFPVPSGFCNRPPNRTFVGTNNIKAAGIFSFEDARSGSSVLVMGVQCQNYGDNPSFNRQHNVDAWLLRSTSGGKSWVNGTTPHSLSGRFASPCFLQQGRGNLLSEDGYVYMYFPAAVDGNAYWCQNDGMLLARARPADVFNYSRWQVVVDLKLAGGPAVGGAGRELAPEWATNPFEAGAGGAVAPPGGPQAARVAPAELAVPVFTYPLMTGENGAVTYNPVLKRYFLPNFSFLHPNRSVPSAWHNSVYDLLGSEEYKHRSQITIFEASKPWGPWRLVWRDDDAGTTFGIEGPYTPSFPSKFVQPNGDMWLSLSGHGHDPKARSPAYALHYAKVTFAGDIARKSLSMAAGESDM